MSRHSAGGIGTFVHIIRNVHAQIMEAENSFTLNINKKQNIFSEKQKGFRDGLSYSTPPKSEETRGNAITQPRSHPIKKM